VAELLCDEPSKEERGSMVALREGLRVPINVIEDHRKQVSEVSFFPSRTADVLDEPLEPCPIPDSTTAVHPCRRASGGFMDSKNDIFRHRGQNGMTCLGHPGRQMRAVT